MKLLKHFEHGNAYITLVSDNGNYAVSLYRNDVLTNTFESTSLDACIEVYTQTCQYAQIVELP